MPNLDTMPNKELLELYVKLKRNEWWMRKRLRCPLSHFSHFCNTDGKREKNTKTMLRKFIVTVVTTRIWTLLTRKSLLTSFPFPAFVYHCFTRLCFFFWIFACFWLSVFRHRFVRNIRNISGSKDFLIIGSGFWFRPCLFRVCHTHFCRVFCSLSLRNDWIRTESLMPSRSPSSASFWGAKLSTGQFWAQLNVSTSKKLLNFQDGPFWRWKNWPVNTRHQSRR
jgi:hypothetical protein